MIHFFCGLFGLSHVDSCFVGRCGCDEGRVSGGSVGGVGRDGVGVGMGDGDGGDGGDGGGGGYRELMVLLLPMFVIWIGWLCCTRYVG